MSLTNERTKHQERKDCKCIKANFMMQKEAKVKYLIINCTDFF